MITIGSMEQKTHSKVPLTIEEMRDMRFLLGSIQHTLDAHEITGFGRDIEWALYTLDHAIECPAEVTA